MKRRKLIRSAGLLGSTLAVAPLAHSSGVSTGSGPKGVEKNSAFLHGVASGDPLQDRFIIWTRISSDDAGSGPLHWLVASDRDFNNVLRQGQLTVSAERDFTAKIDVAGLQEGRQYFYRFVFAGEQSPVGQCRTLATKNHLSARLAVVSCSNFPAGYFNVYREIAKDPGYDAVLHLGDYLYEYGQGGYATENAEALNRVPFPQTEIKSLSDYRKRHGQYKSDVDLQAMHAAHPMICVWDDHEFANNAWQNGSPKEGDESNWLKRKNAALQAYYEWMPVRENSEHGINRHFRFGNLLSLSMLDTRLKGREKQPNRKAFTLGFQQDREMLGEAQQIWLEEQLKSSQDTVWTVIGQQVLLSSLNTPDLNGIADPEGDSMFARYRSRKHYKNTISNSHYGLPLLLDAWDGYPKARERFLKLLSKYGKNHIVLTGDIHTGICSEIPVPGEETKKITELVTASVTSPGLDDYFPSLPDKSVGEAFQQKNPHMSYINGKDKGWLDVNFTKENVEANWKVVDSIDSYNYNVSTKFTKTVQVQS
ncbi:alkaline phosphatase D family protein [Pseudoteredinibacter isoporae]|uniref:Alkaline phosphatase D n=1 Tax=Pseudoteredinibacter isoporae TaxID=570281 RepID=A0A7X0MVF4_9GAMM|nr:alkaline phosphatase D family protein [Pseudoteredinibacter isoporae]MBB6519769.1 alkaline phosphatase D [Pseudoteredinibacter isoporae]NHO85350.1 alkaline phosphatase [Pseudoteredinibacter isoporae]NIB26198.1 alkaline phosphatase [Pseudoteredinibacter isoporae]